MTAERKALQLVPLAGVAFVVLTIISFALGGEPPDADDPVREVVEHYDDNAGVTMLATVVESVAAVALLFFAAAVRRALRRGEDGAGVLSVVAFAGGIVAAAGIGTDAAIRFTLAETVTDVDPAVTQTLNAFWSSFFWPMVIGIATLILATGLAALRTRVIPKWLAWVGFLIVIVFFTPAGFAAFLVSAVWVLIVSFWLWRQEVATARSESGAVTSAATG